MRDYTIKNVPVGSITVSALKVRRSRDATHVAELAASFDEVGIIQPIVVREIGQDEYELLVGEHRLAAACQAKLETVPAIIFSGSDDEAALASVESDLRMYVPSAEERDLLVARYEELYQAKHGRPKVGRPSKTVARRDSFARAAAAAAHKHRSTIYRSLARQKKLTPAVRDALHSGRISASHADEMAKLSPDQQDGLLEEIADKSRGQTRKMVRTALTRTTPAGPALSDVSGGEAEEELEAVLNALREHQVSFRAQLEPAMDAICRAGALMDVDDIEGPDQLLVDILTVIHRMGNVLTEAGHTVQRVRSELRRRVREPQSAFEAPDRANDPSHSADSSTSPESSG